MRSYAARPSSDDFSALSPAVDSPTTDSLFERLRSTDVDISRPPVPKPFAMSEPVQQPGGLWCFWLAADPPILDFASRLGCVLPLSAPPSYARTGGDRVLFGINPRYDYAEAWMWIYRLLEAETQTVELDDLWLQALDDETDGE